MAKIKAVPWKALNRVLTEYLSPLFLCRLLKWFISFMNWLITRVSQSPLIGPCRRFTLVIVCHSLPLFHSLSELRTWFTWCQSCRHGGHADHIAEWFATHKECPVTQCDCFCGSLDALARGVRCGPEWRGMETFPMGSRHSFAKTEHGREWTCVWKLGSK